MVKEERDRMRMEIIRPVYDKMPRRGVIRTDEVDGEFRISSSKDAVSAMPCVMITINDIKTLKLVAGNPDEYFKNGTLKHRTPKVVDLADKNIRVENARQGYANNRMVCDVMDAYIYGDSDAVKQNEALLNQIYFPMQVACFGSDEQDIIVTKDNPLIIDARSGTPIRAEFRKVTLEEGGRVKFYGNVDFSAREIDQKGEASDEGSLCSYGSDGGNGGNGGMPGKVYDNGIPGTPGDAGAAGAAGTAGAAGNAGKIEIVKESLL